MTEITYKIGDATAPDAPGNKVIVHICNDIGGWGKGFVLALSRRWREPEASYRRWYTGRETNDFALGAVQFVPVEADVWVANLVGQRDIRRIQGMPPIRYDAVATGLNTVAAFAQTHQATIHMPRIGCGLAGGNWERIASLIDEHLTVLGIPVTVYDLA